MRKERVFLFLLLLILTPSCFASSITFEEKGSTATESCFTARVDTDLSLLTDFYSATILIGLVKLDGEPLELAPNDYKVSIVYSNEWKLLFEEFETMTFSNYSHPLYQTDVFLDVGRDSSVGSPSLPLGTVKVSTVGLPNGNYKLQVDYNFDCEGFGSLLSGKNELDKFVSDPMYGSVNFTVPIPEPVSLLLFSGVGILGVRRRLRSR